MEMIEKKHDDSHLTQLKQYLYATSPVIRDNQGVLLHKSWNLEPIMEHIGSYPDCMKVLVQGYSETVKNIGADICYQELDICVYEKLVNQIYQYDMEMSVDFARHLSPKSSLFKEIIAQAIDKDLEIAPFIEIIYNDAPELYQRFTIKQHQRPSLKGLKAVLKFFPELISSSTNKREKRLEFTKWLDILDRYLKTRPQEVNFLITSYNLFKKKNEGASAYLLKEVVKRYAPSLL